MKWLGNEQEVIILGSGLGGLAAGTLLARNNHSVLLLKERKYESSYALKGYQFVPFSNLSEKCLKPSLVRKISQTLSLPLLMGTREDGRQTKAASDRSKQNANFQVVLPKARVDILPQRSQFHREWEREFPKEIVQIEGFHNELDRIRDLSQKRNGKGQPSGFFFPFERHSFFKKIFSSDRFPKEDVDKKLVPFSREFREFIQLQLISWGNFRSDRFPITLAAQVLFDETNELSSEIDVEKLEKEILSQFLRSGGRIEEIDRVKEIKPWRHKGFALSLDGNPGVFRSQSLILNAPLHRISSFLGKKGKRLLKWEKKIKPSYLVIPLFFGIHDKVVPVGMKDLLISVLDLEKPYADGNLLFLSLSPREDKTKAPEGKRALTVEGLIDVGKWEQSRLIDYQRGVMRHLDHLFPFLEDYVEFVDFQWVSDHVLNWSYPHFLYETTSDFHWREGVVPMRMSKNIYFVGKENFPYWGLGGEVFSGLAVAQQILKKYR
ncbi:MAG TPA: hypothetical protein VLZ03_01155 [Thermodesulfobacteriota bacterium]|nr:hypothetical protein [Thermodesulfobacteriota bacterium]